MKVTLYAIFVCVVFMGAVYIGQADAGLWEKLSTMDLPTKKPTSAYLVEASGWNVRVYEFTPEGNKNYVCVFIAGSKKAGASCFPKSN